MEIVNLPLNADPHYLPDAGRIVSKLLTVQKEYQIF